MVSGNNKSETEYDGFLHFSHTAAHYVLPRWSPAFRSRNLVQ
jgi:hypothetical protein